MEQTEFMAAAADYQDMIYRVALHQTASPQDAEDTVQEVLLRLYTSTKTFESPKHLRRWLLRVTVNAARDLLRSPWRRRRVSLSELPETPAFQEPEQEELYQAVLALPEKYRAVLDLFYYEELSAREIGEVLGIRASAVTTRLSRARAMLKEQLKEGWQDE